MPTIETSDGRPGVFADRAAARDAVAIHSATDLHAAGRPVVVAVSGGSDSVALLHWLLKHCPSLDLHVATVDHQLRPESATEARSVAELCDRLDLPHNTLIWENTGRANSASSREARYDLLHHHARNLDAAAIVLGHTLDDQAETVFMRAQRARQDSGTRGLSGMAEWSTFNGIRLWRPLLRQSRQHLRDGLRQQNISWIDDPSNQDVGYERIRVRRLLASVHNDFASTAKLARLGNLASRSRHWMNQQVAAAIQNQVELTAKGSLIFQPNEDLPRPVVLEVLALLILVAGGLPHRSPAAKLVKFADAMRRGERQKSTLGRCLISSHNGVAEVEREDRNLPPFPKTAMSDWVYDGRILIQPSPSGVGIDHSAHIVSLESFRPATDDSLYIAIMELLDSDPRST